MAGLDPAVEWLAVDADPAFLARAARLVVDGACDLVATASAIADAVKQVDADGVVVGELDRGELVELRAPAVVRRAALVEALAHHPPDDPADDVLDAVALVAASGRVRLA